MADNPFAHLHTLAEIIEAARRHEIVLEVGDVQGTEGAWTIDGMPADQWLDAMTMD